jgi:hypothetical protein
MGQVYRCWRRICREINIFPKFEYHMFYVLYPFVTYLLTSPRAISKILVIKGANTKTTAFWDVPPCSLIKRYRHSWYPKMERVDSSEKLVSFYQTLQRHAENMNSSGIAFDLFS